MTDAQPAIADEDRRPTASRSRAGRSNRWCAGSLDDPFADFIVHEAAHILHNCKRATVGLRETRRNEWLRLLELSEERVDAAEVAGIVAEAAAARNGRKIILIRCAPTTGPEPRRMTDMGKKKLPQNIQDWVEARKRHHLSHAHVQMARELGMNPRKIGKLDNHGQEPWKAPLPHFIEDLYWKRFSRERPEVVMSVEERARAHDAKSAARKEEKRRVEGDGHPQGEPR